MSQRWYLSLALSALVACCAAPAARADEEKPKEKAAEQKKADTGRATVAVFRLHGDIAEVPAEDPFGFGVQPVSLKDLVERLRKAADDSAVKAVVFFADGAAVGHAQVEELRQAMKKLRDAGKEVYAHADSLSMRDYVLLSGASRLSVVPTGDLWINGLYGEAPYIRGLLNKIGVQPDFLTCGEYKSAAEMFMREGPSPAADKMQNWLLDSVFDTYLDLIARGRGVDVKKARAWVDGGHYSAEKAKAAGLIDAVEQRQELEAALEAKYGKRVTFDRKYGAKKLPHLDLSSPLGVFKLWADLLSETTKKKSTKDAVGIVYVDGPISLGGGSPSPFGSEGAFSTKVRKALDEAARDDSVKAVVLRVNSPGGSAVASEIILDATRRVKAKKPFVVSMGDVAGSGGYYVACGSDTIFADESTITGSIGVVAGKLVTTKMWNSIGITFKAYQRGANAALLSSSEPWNDTERAKIQGWMDEVYEVFKNHVVAVRGKRLKKPIDELAGGRVYTGRQALELGLVDKIGTLQDAVHHVAAAAKLKDYDVRVVPEPKNFLEQLLEEIDGPKEDSRHLAVPARADSLVELAMPYLKGLDPERVKVIRLALQRLQLVQQEGVILMMPELAIGR